MPETRTAVYTVPDRGPAAYVAEFVGTLLLVFMVTSVVTLYVATEGQAQFGSDFAVVGLVHAFVLFLIVQTLAAVSGAHVNPAVTLAILALRRIKPIDAAIYMLVQLSGGVAGALLTKAFLLDEGRAADYGAVQVSGLLGGNLQGALIEAIGAFLLVFVVITVAINPRARRDWAALSIGLALGLLVMVFGPLTGASVNPARWFGPALVGNEWASVWPYVIGPAVGALLAAAFYARVIEPGEEQLAATTPPPAQVPGHTAP